MKKRCLSAFLSAALLISLLIGSAAMPASATQKKTSSDVRALLYALAHDLTPSAPDADFNGDGRVDTDDGRRMLMAVASNEVDYLNVLKTDAFGERSIAVLGDSISHGAGAGDIPQNSYVGLIKQAVNAKTGDNNYGFTSVEGTLWGAVQSKELHAFPTSSCGFRDRNASGSGWAEYRTAELLGIKGLGHTRGGEWLEFSPKKTFQYFCVYYQAGPSNGSFTVSTDSGNKVLADVNGNTTVNCYAAQEGGTRTAFYDMSRLVSNKLRITVSGSGKEVIITGIGYYDTPNGVVVTNYSNGGLQFAGTGKSWNGDVTGLDKKYIALAATSETLIFSLGYNDAHFDNDRTLFVEKMDYLISECKKNNTNVIVNDMCWYIPSCTSISMDYDNIQWYKAQLKRLAKETNGIYLDQQAISGDAIIGTISDGAHPKAAGHKVIADNILAAMGIA